MGRRRRCIYLVELFSGSRSVSKAVRRCFRDHFDVRVLSVDTDPASRPSIVADINTWRYKEDLRYFLADKRQSDMLFVWMSPPCTSFSRANTTGVRDLQGGRRNVLSGLKITRHLSPDAWFLENPVGLLMEQDFMQKLKKHLNIVSYCRYGKPYRKNTCIWTPVARLGLKVCAGETRCKAKTVLGFHPVTAQSGGTARALGSGGGRNVYPIPSALVRHLFRKAVEQVDGESPGRSG